MPRRFFPPHERRSGPEHNARPAAGVTRGRHATRSQLAAASPYPELPQKSIPRVYGCRENACRSVQCLGVCSGDETRHEPDDESQGCDDHGQEYGACRNNQADLKRRRNHENGGHRVPPFAELRQYRAKAVDRVTGTTTDLRGCPPHSSSPRTGLGLPPVTVVGSRARPSGTTAGCMCVYRWHRPRRHAAAWSTQRRIARQAVECRMASLARPPPRSYSRRRPRRGGSRWRSGRFSRGAG